PPAAEPTSTRPLWAVPKGGSAVAVPAQGRRYRGVIRAEGAGSGLHLVNELDVEQYLRGMGEVLEPGWPAASLRAQAIAARTYALRAMATDGRLCNSQQCQVYLGETVEYAAMNKAVADTRGQVLVQGGALIEAVYSANGGGVSATPIEGFGADFGDFPYLRSAPYPTLDPSPWTVRLQLPALASRVGYPGRATGARVSQAGPSGRALEVTVDGDAGPMAVAGLRFVEVLGLRSGLFSIRIGDAAVGGSADPGQPTTGAVGDLRPPEGPPTVVRAGPRALGRSPWVALALLLLAAWGISALVAVGGRRPAGEERAS
ncbi:MAG TPA: SpoIID/LytB domain-containing protein, partial [Acidimicrobiales bacterium]|nr:SpoIID/LytB domain-containing protein [Acidimicrobiales bacterium]